MPVGATFGSLGDVVSLCILIKDVCKALSQSKGSSSEYREIIAELCALVDVLTQADLLCQERDSSGELENLYIAVCRSVSLCRTSIERFRETV